MPRFFSSFFRRKRRSTRFDTVLLTLCLLGNGGFSVAQNVAADSTQPAPTRPRSRADSVRAASRAARRPTLRWTDRYATRLATRQPASPLLLGDPRGLRTDFRLDPNGQIIVSERINPAPGNQSAGAVALPQSQTQPSGGATSGNGAGVLNVPGNALPGLLYRPGQAVPFQEYSRAQDQQVRRSIWREYGARQDGQSATRQRSGLIPRVDLPPAMDMLFGQGGINFQPNGFVGLDIGYLHQFIDNPALPVQLRRQGNLLFNEQINLALNGTIGERLGLLINYDTKAAFNFENAVKLNYRPFGNAAIPGLNGQVPNFNQALPGLQQNVPGAPGLPGAGATPNLDTPGVPTFGNNAAPLTPSAFIPPTENIIQNIEAGNFSWNLNSQLIPGVQNLFGLKVQTRFGRLNATLVASQQRSRQQTIVLRGGAVGRPYEVRGSLYDENRHFFLSQFFRDQYERGLRSLPAITTGVTVTRVEVYVTNRTNNTATLRNIAGFSDLGESGRLNNPANPNLQPLRAGQVVDNATNGLFARLTANSAIRSVDQTANVLETGFAMARGVDYDLLRGARRLSPQEFSISPQLGFISLQTALRNDEVLAVSYEYTYQGRRYQVGELTENYQNQPDDGVILLKLLKSATIRNNLQLPMWDLMMKNIYTVSNTGFGRQNFQLRLVYKDDQTGIDNPNLQESSLQGIPLVQVFGMDQLNPQNDVQPDGNFDYVEGVTVESRFGRVMFPVLEPFGSFLQSRFRPEDAPFREKYVFSELYRLTQADAIQVTTKDKFFLRGSFLAGTGADVSLPPGVSEQSVQVTAGGVPLAPGQDYILEAQIGRLRIVNESVLQSGREIRINYEQPDLFQNQIRTLLGTRLDYLVSPNLSVGLTAMRLREQPAGFLTRVALGNEPVNNTMLGADVNFRKESRMITNILDKLPFVQTKEISAVQFRGEIAQLLPGVAPRVNQNSFVDDFEATRLIFDLTRQPTRWRLGATPQSFPQGSFANPLPSAFQRARISAYTVDQTIYQPGVTAATGTNLTDADRQNFYERYFLPNDIFPGRAVRQIQLPENILDISYFPAERGMYNYNPDLNADGTLKNPRQNFGAITRAVQSDNDFDNANVENITFWLMDPFIPGDNGKVRGNPDDRQNRNNTTGGRLVFNLGDVSEDVAKDNRFGFENGLPTGAERERGADSTAWGRVTREQFVTNAFLNQPGARAQQDVGLDGLANNEEPRYFQNYLNSIRSTVAPDAFQRIAADPSGDNFRFYLGPQGDSLRYVVSRYKYFMGMDGNSPEPTTGDQLITPASTNLPDSEDLNQDNTINENEAYYEYDLDLRPGQLEVGRGFIIDKVVAQGATWYFFRVPLRQFSRAVGNINGFKSIRFMRMYLTDFAEPVVLRFAQLQMEANQYRRYVNDLNQPGQTPVPEPYDAQYKVSAVNIEENGPDQNGTVAANKWAYTVPPGFIRDRDFTQINGNVELNEQSQAQSVVNLRAGDSRGAFRNFVGLNLLFHKRLRMFIHAHNTQNESGRVSAFVRLGTDNTQNYYEIEIPRLRATRPGTSDPIEVWPSENELDLALRELVDLKAARNDVATRLSTAPFSRPSENGRYILTVVGNPDLSAILNVMLGVRNPRLGGDESPRSFTVWFNEMRASGFDQTAGGAAAAALNMKLADIGTLTASGRLSTFGFGGVQTKISDRSLDNSLEYSVSTALSLDRFLPEKWGLRIPFYMNYDRRRITPQFNPLDPDMPLKQALGVLPDGQSPDEYRRLVEDNSVRRGYNFSNVRKVKINPDAPARFYDVENFGFNYAYNEARRTNILTGEYLQLQHRGGINYTFNSDPKAWEPFKRFQSLERKNLYWLRDFSLKPFPTLISLRTDVDRSFIQTQLRNADLTTNGIPAQVEKWFFFNRNYDLNWNLTPSLVVRYGAQANAIIDEPAGPVNTDVARDSIWSNIRKLGRIRNYQQSITATYRLPFDKFTFLDWLQADATYGVGYQFQANAFGLRDSTQTLFGNFVRNNRDRQITGRVDLIRLYDKITKLRWANSPNVPRKNFTRSPGDDEDVQTSDNRLTKAFVRALLTVRGINFSYRINETTILPGFLPTPRFFGQSPEGAPGLGFIMGSQDPNVRFRGAREGWLSRSIVQNQPFTQTLAREFTAGTTLEPFRDFRAVINMRYTRADNYQEFFRPGVENGPFQSFSPVRNGQFSMSYLSFNTTFIKLRPDNTSPVFERFEQHRAVILDRLNRENPAAAEGRGAYDKNAQDVLIPAFFAAYSGEDPRTVRLSPFRGLPLPNWDVTYNGLGNVAPFNKTFSSFAIRHAYTSTYSVGNYVSALEYGSPDFGTAYVNLAVQGYPLSAAVTPAGQFIPVFVMSTITMSERFAPFLGVQFQTRSRVSGRLEYNRSRDVALNLANAQVAELTNRDVTATVGFTRQNFRLPFRINGAVRRLKNDLTFQCALTFRDTRAIQRKLDAEQIVTAGNINFQLRPTINYVVSRRINFNLYFDRTFNNPLVSNSFIRATTAGGVQLRFNLAE